MKHKLFEILQNRKPVCLIRWISRYGMIATQVALFCLCPGTAKGQADPGDDGGDTQVLTRGPVHEAFAGTVSYNPESGVIVAKAPPEAIDELPPETRPVGDNINWIPGYWGWDDERGDFLWISGTWRELPPGRRWTSGYWGVSGQGHQWISGYWADASLEETTYLPRPPVTVEIGPNIEAPSMDHTWTPGSWMWSQERYAWRPGYWVQGRSDWDWIPAQYVWTPRGYVFVDGYWDRSFDRRGVLYAPVQFHPGYHSSPGHSYSPVIAIGLVAMMEHLFLRPDYHHYYFGDYYEQKYRDDGYYTPYAYQSGRHGYDPVYASRRYMHRQDKNWERLDEESYDYRRDHEAARPPRTWDGQKGIKVDAADARQRQPLMVGRFDEMAKREGSPLRVEPVSAKDRLKITDQGGEVRKSRDKRMELEAGGGDIAKGEAEKGIKPTKVRLPASPIVGRSPDRLKENQAPPKPQRAPEAEPEKETSDRKPSHEKARPEPKKEQPDPRRGEVPVAPKTQPRPERSEEKPARQKPPPKRESKRETREEPRQPEKVAPAKEREEAKPKEPAKIPETEKEDSERSSGRTPKKESEQKQPKKPK